MNDDILKSYQNTHMNEMKSLGVLFRENLLYVAVRTGNTSDLQELIENLEHRSDTLNVAMGLAAHIGQKECVLILLPHCNPKHDHSKILLACARHDWQDLLDDLWNVCDPLDLLNSIPLDASDAKQVIETKWRAQHDKKIIKAFG